MTGQLSVLICTDVTARGGVDLYVGQLVDGYLARGAEVVVGLDRRLDAGVRDRLAAQGATVSRTDLGSLAREDGTAARGYGALVESASPDVVHLVRGSHRSGHPLVAALSSHPARLVVTEQYIPDDTRLGAEHRALVRSLYERAATVVFVSEANRATMAASIEEGATPWTVVPNAVDVAAIGARAIDPHERRRRLDQRPVRLMAASRFTEQKGLDVLIDAIAQLPVGVVSTAIFGEGPEEQALRDRAAVLAPGVLSFRPWCVDVVGALGDADLFVLPSRNEGMPFTLLEAMAAGVPIVAADAPGVAEALGPGGLVVPRDDPVALASALLDAVADPAATLIRVAVALRRVRGRHDVRTTMQATLDLALGA